MRLGRPVAARRPTTQWPPQTIYRHPVLVIIHDTGAFGPPSVESVQVAPNIVARGSAQQHDHQDHARENAHDSGYLE